jgi:hypothetical protein
MREKPYPGMGNVSKAEGLYLQKSPQEIELWRKRFEARFDKNLIAERGIALSLFNCAQKGNLKDPNIQKVLEKDYRVWWMADCIAWEIIQVYHLCFDREKREELFSIIDQKFLKAKAEFLRKLKDKNPDQYYLSTPNICLLSQEIRWLLKKPRLTSRQIHKLMWDLAETKIKRKSPAFISKDGDYSYRYGDLIDIVSGEVKFLETEYLRHKSKEPEYAYLVIFEKPDALDFFYSVRLGFFDFMGDSYYKMSSGAQLIFRFVGVFGKETHLTLERLCTIAQTKSTNITYKRNTIEKYLNELQQNKFVRGWYRKNNVYTIFKVHRKRLPWG